MRPFLFAAALAIMASSCSRDPAAKGAAGGTAEEEGPKVTLPAGYRDFAWGAARDEIAAKHPDARPGKRDPSVLVRDVTLDGKTATEAFFFDSEKRLVEVEIRYVPKRTPREAAELTRGFDKEFGPHDVPLADENQYQAAWIGDAAEVRLTYDLREQIAFGPVVTWARREGGGGAVPSATPSAMPSAAPAAGGAATAGRFAASVKETRAAGLHLVDVESTGGKVVLVYAGPSEAVEIALAADPKSGALVGTAALPRAVPAEGAATQARLEAALDEELAKSLPKTMTFGGPAGMKELVTITFASGRFLSIDPGAKDALVSRTVTP